jgi:hypothetical protein
MVMSNYIEKVLAKSKPTITGVPALDMDSFLSGLRYDNDLRSVVSPFEFKRYRDTGVRASYSHRSNGDVHVDFFWGLKQSSKIPASYPKDGIAQDGSVIWESCFCVTFFTERSVERGRAKRIILPEFTEKAKQRCYVKAHMRSTGETMKSAQNAYVSHAQLEALEAILRRFDETGDEEGIEFAAVIPCEMVIQNG